MTVEVLHERIEEWFGPQGWRAFTVCWQEAAGIKQPPRKAADRTPAQPKDHGKPSTRESLVPLPSSSACLLEEGLLGALSLMPPRVATFFLYSPQPEPVWRFSESESERSIRLDAESRGAWAG
jgi:hypothetical protein